MPQSAINARTFSSQSSRPRIRAVFDRGAAHFHCPQDFTLADLAVLLSTYTEQSGQRLKDVTITVH